MSHRTQDLPPLRGLSHVFRELRYHEASRQLLAIVLIVLYTSVAQPTLLLFCLGVPVVLAGAAFRLYASGFILKNEELATSGPYALARHPLYTGNILIILGFSVCAGRWWGLPLALLFFYFYYPPAIEYEDRKLRRLFGSSWEQWAETVPAIVPTLKNLSALGFGEWSFLTSAKRNGEPVIVLFILGCLCFVAWQLP